MAQTCKYCKNKITDKKKAMKADFLIFCDEECSHLWYEYEIDKEMKQNQKAQRRAKNVIDYIGAKNKLAPKIIEVLERHTGKINGAEFVDLFAGTGAISRYLLQNRKMKSIATNDIEAYSSAVCLATTRPISFAKNTYDLLNAIEGFKGFITKTCTPAGAANRKFFTVDNAMKIDGIKFHIINMYKRGIIAVDEMIKLLGELTIAADRISNTASVYGAYLKKYKTTALADINLKRMEPGFRSDTIIWNMRMDANELINELSGDILYIDPPYNQRQYADNYHVLNYIADSEAEDKYNPQGVTGLPKLSERNRSVYCNKKKVGAALDQLIDDAKFNFIVLSYNNRGLLEFNTIKMILEAHGQIIDVERIVYNNFKADKNRTYDSDKTTEYIFVIKKSKV